MRGGRTGPNASPYRDTLDRGMVRNTTTGIITIGRGTANARAACVTKQRAARFAYASTLDESNRVTAERQAWRRHNRSSSFRGQNNAAGGERSHARSCGGGSLNRSHRERKDGRAAGAGARGVAGSRTAATVGSHVSARCPMPGVHATDAGLCVPPLLLPASGWLALAGWLPTCLPASQPRTLAPFDFLRDFPDFP